ncbi:WD40 repeat-like protein [Microstroma glucosiphilum]|uniref:Elongator complex protein 2 n=1 Tax=Pseudomicrostroma glucosiphilum TaxID=1684307 RepID=A0A316U8H8_9BASI|nr:WD40 repeat-like protein [Pseudomicrostroma glucosiphilum]PWN21550.1 WD40 repeat-like protein [Pseudomicrostroma glucosiphilum]
MAATEASAFAGQVQPRDIFVSAAANRYSHAADWGSIQPDGDGGRISVLAYGSHRSVAFAYNLGESDSSYRGLSQLLPTPFSSPITTLKFIATSLPHAIAFVAGAGNGQAAIWVGEVDGNSQAKSDGLWKPIQWRLAVPLAGMNPQSQSSSAERQSGTVQAIGVLRSQGQPAGIETTLVAIGTSDGTISIWSVDLTHRTGDESSPPALLQTIDASRKGLDTALPLDIAITALPIAHGEIGAFTATSPLLMATASTDRKIVFWLSDGNEGVSFRKVLTLSGHDDWVRSLDFSASFPVANDRQVELASGSQDGSVRLWRIRPHAEAAATGSDAFDVLAKQLEDEASQQNDATGSSLSNKVHAFGTSMGTWAVSFDALLTGHESWVTGVRWQPPILSLDDKTDQPAALLSSSVDNSIILWTPSVSSTTSTKSRLIYPSLSSKDATSSLWLPSQRFGELGVAGAGALGMFGALWTPNWHSSGSKQLILSHAWAGAIHLWGFDEKNNKWESAPAVTGHSLPVKSARWAPEGDWFLTASLDRTARLFGTYNRKTNTAATQITTTSWHELARPQTHGYDICSAAWLDDLSFASAGDEKVARIFAAPQGFVQSAQRLGSKRSAAAQKPTAKQNVLVMALPSIGHIRNPHQLRNPIEAATKESCSSAHKRLVILLFSPAFDALSSASAEGPEETSYDDVESLLRGTYATAWAAANKEDALLLDIDVLLVGQKGFETSLRALAGDESGVEHLWAMEAHSDSLPNSLPSKPVLLKASATAESVNRDEKGPIPSSFPHHRSIALGGTFDHLHVGHKILLSMAALIATDRIVVGVTGDSMLAKKSNAYLLEPLEERIAAVERFLTTFRSTMTPLQQDVVELADVCGPAGSDGSLEALLVTEETLSGADTIAKTREERGLGPLERYVIGVVGAGGEVDVKGDAAELAAAKVGSTAIRKWLSEQSPKVQAVARRKRRRDLKRQGDQADGASSQATNRPMAASAPALGLSNRAIFEGQAPQTETNELGRQVAAQTDEPISSVFTRPPVEEELLVSTLWPELDKLYGHGYELLAVDSSPDNGRLTATSCKSTTAEHSLVRVYDREDNWKEIAVLPGHSLTITRIRFSPNGKWLLTVSRDRSWRLFSREDRQGQVSLSPRTHKESAHARIIWDAAWADDSRTFATAARDKAVKVWRLKATIAAPQEGEDAFELVATVTKLPEAATAVAFDVGNRLAVGLENGDVLIYQLEGSELRKIVSLPRHHGAAVNELAWRSQLDEAQDGQEEQSLLLSAGEDGAVRLTSM